MNATSYTTTVSRALLPNHHPLRQRNHGEIAAQRSGKSRLFDLRPSPALSALRDRLVVEWSKKDAINRAKIGRSASAFAVVEIADPGRVPFPGFDRVLLTYSELQSLVTDSRYSDWRTALGAVQGIYAISDANSGSSTSARPTDRSGSSNGGPLTRRTVMAAMSLYGTLADLDPAHAQHFRFSILRVFGPSVPTPEIDEAESPFKQALLTRQHGLNRN